VVAVGALLRLERYLDDRSLWLDEAFLSLNIVEKSTRDLLGSLDYQQSAPPGFLLVEKGAVGLFGDSELALRLFPLLAGIAGLVLFAVVARRLLAPLPSLLAIILFATNEPLLYYSSEVKPYGSDVTVGLLLVYLFLRVDAMPAERLSASRLLPLALVGIGAVWLSFPAAFVLAAIFVALAVRAWTLGRARAAVLLAPVAVLLVASFGAVYAVARNNISRISAALFPSGGNGHGDSQIGSTVRETWSTVVDPIGFKHGTNALAVLAIAFALGAIVRRDSRSRLALITVPFVLAFIAAASDKYPLGGRFSLFLVPFALILVARGVEELAALSRNPVLLAAPIVVLLALPPVAEAAKHAVHLRRPEHVRPLLGYMAEHWRPGDTLYVYRNAQYALRYYAECGDCDVPRFPWPVKPARRGEPGFTPALESAPPTVFVGREEGLDGELRGLDRALPRSGRVWLLFTHVLAPAGLTEESLLTLDVARRGRLIEERHKPGASIYLFSLPR